MTAPTPLAGIKVLDFSKVLAGPLCAQYLGDMGADVIKIEPLEHGDDTRRWPPFRGEDGTVFLSANRNKRSLAIDLKSVEGREVCYRLAASADVMIESFGPGVASRLGIDAKSLHSINPKLICCSISGFGSSGPMREGKGYDVILQAFSGMMSITGERGGKPLRSPFSPVDQATGIHALVGILAALIERGQSGRGRVIEASLFDTSVAFLGYFLQGFWERGTEPEKPGSGHESLCPYEAFDASDKPLILGVANDALWRAFCGVAGLDDIVDDARFATNAERVRHREETVAIVRRVIATRTCDEWVHALSALGIPCSPINSLGEMAAHEHTGAVGMTYSYEHPRYGAVRAVAQPLKFDGERGAQQLPPPSHGEHSKMILRECGYSAAEIERLINGGVVHNAGVVPASTR